MSRWANGHRLFFALQPPAPTRAAIQSIQQALDGEAGRRVPPERLHSTLLFLGLQSTGALDRLRAIASELSLAPCTVILDHLGHFPRARVAWLGPADVPGELDEFQKRLAGKVAETGIGHDRRGWKMHVTLYRELRTRPGMIDFEPVEWPVRSFCLMESIQDQSGLCYITRGRWKCRAGP